MSLLAKSAAARPRQAGQVAAALGRFTSQDAAQDAAQDAVGPRRPVVAVDVATHVLATDRRAAAAAGAAIAPPATWVVLAQGEPDAETSPETLAAQERTLRAALEPHGVTLDMLTDESLLVTIPAALPPADQANIAARCALALRAVLPTAPIVISSGVSQVEAVERGSRTLDAATMQAIFAASVAIHLDRESAQLLEADFEVTTHRQGTKDAFHLHHQKLHK